MAVDQPEHCHDEFRFGGTNELGPLSGAPQGWRAHSGLPVLIGQWVPLPVALPKLCKVHNNLSCRLLCQCPGQSAGLVF